MSHVHRRVITYGQAPSLVNPKDLAPDPLCMDCGVDISWRSGSAKRCIVCIKIKRKNRKRKP